MKNKLLNNLAGIFFLLITAVGVKGQGGNTFSFYIGLPLQIQPMADVGIQLKHYWVFDSNYSNNGPGAACEFNFGTNNSGITVGPKLFYQVDVHMCEIGSKKKKSSLYLVARLSIIRYTNRYGNDVRFAPEAGLSLSDAITLSFRYNFPLTFKPENKLEGVFDNQLTLYVYFNRKPGRK